MDAPIAENPQDKFGYISHVETIGFGKFYNFKKESAPEPLEVRDIPRFYLFRSGKAYVTNMEEFRSCRVFTRRITRKQYSKSASTLSTWDHLLLMISDIWRRFRMESQFRLVNSASTTETDSKSDMA